MLQIIACGVFHNTGHVGVDTAIRQNRLKAQHPMSHHAVAMRHDTTCICRNHAANGGGATRGQINARLQPMQGGGGLQDLQRNARLHHRYALLRQDRLDLCHAGQRPVSYTHLDVYKRQSHG